MFSICQIRLKIYALTQNKILALFVEIWKFVTVFLCICSYGFMLKTCLHKRLSLDNISKTVKWWTGITNQQVDKKHIYIYTKMSTFRNQMQVKFKISFICYNSLYSSILPHFSSTGNYFISSKCFLQHKNVREREWR